ncbi:amidohydrolase family protein [Nguyenibacter vanlangensis]|uniref:Amidohydrolase family protein n=1 Tax=Nguyenibacter vanlangensis TaxID=1216886 RepID=A0A7Y7IWK7_9PROT|nr:amidohydrolase family protein [Nguyenibacter vanlangensis]NVN11706.1 amidohydrolase family protein [Nguyenibacter vanlangensis]
MYDLIIRGGRLIDPETRLDAIGDVAIRNGAIMRVGDVAGPALREIDATGLVVAPGFIDIHAHGQSVPADRMQAFDGVTTTLECEVGSLPVAGWYDAQDSSGRVLNYGVSVGWVFARIAAMTGRTLEPSLSFMGRCMDDPRWVETVAGDAELEDILSRVRRGLDEGGVGIGIPNAYVPGAGVKEISRICSLAAEYDVPTYTHVAYASNIDPRSSIEAYTRLIGYAGSTGARMHICHFNSTSLMDVERAADLVRTAQAQGLKVTVEAYPYGVASTVIGAPFFADPAFPERTGRGYDALQRLDDGRRIGSRAELLQARAERPENLVLWHFLDVEGDARHRDLLDVSVLYPGGIIASDAMPWTLPDGTVYGGDAWPLPADAVSHPRSSGTFARFLRVYMRERGMLSLMEAMAKCSWLPASIVAPAAPAMRRKGRLQEGCDADLCVFDDRTIGDRADFAALNRPSEGVRHLLVNGQPVIDDGTLRRDAAPGRPVRGRRH